MKTNRRNFLRMSAGSTFFILSGKNLFSDIADNEILARVEDSKPSKKQRLPTELKRRIGSTHVAGKYHLTKKPFLLEGAEKLLSLGTRLGKFWLIPRTTKGDYSFNSNWGDYKTILELISSEYYSQLLEMPFETLIFEAQSPIEERWRNENLLNGFYKSVSEEFYNLTSYLYKKCRNKDVTIILQHWEGDWMLRGKGGEMWNVVPQNWQQLCKNMQKWLAARQKGVTTARNEYGKGAKCVVANATEVNRVVDIWKNIPTVTKNVLPYVELDLVSYSSYDGMKDPITMWKCVQEIKSYAKTSSLFGEKAVYVGEIGIPENIQKDNIKERWDSFMGVFLATGMKYVVQWELYCNELKPSQEKIKLPVTDSSLMRGFWLVKPDGSLSESGEYFTQLWNKAVG